MLEPRRVAARAAATRLAFHLKEKPGKTVGYSVRFDSQVSAATRIEVVTEGILARRIVNDPELKGVGLIIFDEFHERHVETDLALARARRLRSAAPGRGPLDQRVVEMRHGRIVEMEEVIAQEHDDDDHRGPIRRQEIARAQGRLPEAVEPAARIQHMARRQDRATRLGLEQAREVLGGRHDAIDVAEAGLAPFVAALGAMMRRRSKKKVVS